MRPFDIESFLSKGIDYVRSTEETDACDAMPSGVASVDW
jgi:hypothetical protein